MHHFVDAYHHIAPGDSACPALDAYFAAASPGLKAYASKFGVGAKDVCRAIRAQPTWYAGIEGKLPTLDSSAHQIREIYARYLALDSVALLPSVYFVVGNGTSGGTTVGWRNPIVLIGVERTGNVERIAGTIAHEFVHTQQHYPYIGAMSGGPTFLQGSLLRHSIKEGSANLVAEVLTGDRQGNAYGEAHAGELWQEFRRDMHGKDFSRWVYNGWNAKALGDRPADLGYWMGYQISKAYYDKASDKRQAVRDIMSIRDFDRFLAESGYAGVPSLSISHL
ncbi:MAG: DUF2268 domain-containing putative Zn-dependent protease [bacterium]